TEERADHRTHNYRQTEKTARQPSSSGRSGIRQNSAKHARNFGEFRNDYLTGYSELTMSLNTELSFVPKSAMTARQTTAMRNNIKPYSTMVAPSCRTISFLAALTILDMDSLLCN